MSRKDPKASKGTSSARPARKLKTLELTKQAQAKVKGGYSSIDFSGVSGESTNKDHKG